MKYEDGFYFVQLQAEPEPEIVRIHSYGGGRQWVSFCRDWPDDLLSEFVDRHEIGAMIVTPEKLPRGIPSVAEVRKNAKEVLSILEKLGSEI